MVLKVAPPATDATDGRNEVSALPAGSILISFLSPTDLVPRDTYIRADPTEEAESDDLVVGSGARLADGVRLRRSVVWDGEEVPENFSGESGVFAGGTFYACGDPASGER